MKIIKEFLVNKEKEIIQQSNKHLNKIEKSWKEFLKQEVYLASSNKKHFLNIVQKGVLSTKIPWYLFLDFKFKSNLKKNKSNLNNFNDLIQIYNSHFIEEKRKQYKELFKKGDLILDEDQQTAIITDDKHNLVVAGAGSGKTEVLITRIAYLIKRKSDSIEPKRILALAFQNKASEEIKERLKKRYNLDVDIRTFHSLGNKIIADDSKIKKIKAPKLKDECSEEWRSRKYIQQLFDAAILNNPSLQNEIINFMKMYGDKEKIKKETDLKEKEEFYEYQRNLTYTALDGTQVKSEGEREIFNFFLMHKLNGEKIKILYENPANWMKYKNQNGEEIIPKPDFYFPDFKIYLEHWAINENRKVPKWFKGDNPTKEYLYSMNIKKEKYNSNNQTLFETTYADFKKENFSEILSKRFLDTLSKKNPDIKYRLEKLSYKELVESVWESAQFVKQMPRNIANFIVIAKTYRLYPKDIEKRLTSKNWSARQESFGKIANHIYKIYQMELKNGQNIDFADMINLAVDKLKENPNFYKEKYDHILIDEYQDISTQRYELVRELMSKNKKSKLFCVGDDWQSIMGFAGSNLDFFVNFSKYFSDHAKTDLIRNYRSIKSIVDVGSSIISNNHYQIEKKTVAHLDQSKPILVFASKHSQNFDIKYYEQIAKHCFDLIKKYHTEKNYSYGDFMILMRIVNKKKLRNYITSYSKKLGVPISEKSDRSNCVRLMSIHKSKGLQAKVVIILNVDSGLYGFPCELENPDILELAEKNNVGLREEEERRLFYVAVTRAKEEVIIYTRKSTQSKFITEIKDFVKREELSY